MRCSIKIKDAVSHRKSINSVELSKMKAHPGSWEERERAKEDRKEPLHKWTLMATHAKGFPDAPAHM